MPFTIWSARAALRTRRPMSLRLRPRTARRISSCRLRQTLTSFIAWSTLRPWATHSHVGQRENVPREPPEHENLGFALPPQALQDPHSPRRVPGERGLAELEDVEPRAVGDGIADRVGRYPAVLHEQRQLVDLLLGGQQVAFDTRRQQVDRLVVRRETGASQPSGEPRRQICERRRPAVDPHRGIRKDGGPPGTSRV